MTTTATAASATPTKDQAVVAAAARTATPAVRAAQPAVKASAKTVAKAVTKPSAKVPAAPQSKSVPAAKKTAASPAKAKPAQPVAKASAKPVKTAATKAASKVTAPKQKPLKLKMVRDSFTFPQAEHERLVQMKKRLIALGTEVKKGELVRAGLSLLSALDQSALVKAVAAVDKMKTGRPKK